MNPFAAHDANQAAYETMISEPLGSEPDPGPWVNYAGAQWIATVGPFALKQVLQGGGFVSMLLAEVIIRKAVAGDGVKFNSGDHITVKQVGGTEKKCAVESVDVVFTEYRLTVIDINQ